MENIITNTELIEPFICVIGSKCGVGKTSLQIMLATKALKENKKVLFLSADETPKSIIDRFRKIIDLNESTKLDVMLYDNTKFMDDLKVILKNNDFDLIVLNDSNLLDKDELLKSIEYLYFMNKSVLISPQLNDGFPTKTINIIRPRILQISTYFYILEKKIDFSFFQKLKFILMFWKTKPNRTLKTIKNRYGDNFASNDFFLNVEQLKIK